MHQTPTGDGILELDPHMMRKLELTFEVIDQLRKLEMEKETPDA